MSRIPRSDTKLAANERYGVDPLANLLLDRTVRLAVTGLSGAGKTVFVTSVIPNLLSAAHAPAILPLLGVKGRGRLVSARIASGTALSRKLFPYAEAIAAMAGTPPVWPEGTRDISQIRIAIRYRPEGLAVRQFGPATLYLDIIDYPGRTEEQTSELQSLMRNPYAVFCLNKKRKKHIHNHNKRQLKNKNE